MYSAKRFKKDLNHIIAANIGYLWYFEDAYGSSGTMKVFGPNNKSAYYAIETLNEDRHRIYYFRTVSEMIKEIRRDFNKYKKLFPGLALITHEDLINNRAYDNVVNKDLSKFLRKLISRNLVYRKFKPFSEGAELYFKKQEIVPKKKVFDLLVAKGKLDFSDFNKYYGPMGEEGENISDRIKHYTHEKWDIYLDVKTKRGIDEVIQLLDNVSFILKRKGYGKLCYGKVLLVDNLGGNTLADYDPKDDYMRIGFKVLKKSNAESQIRSTIHELGHRNYFKFLSPKQREESDSKYLTEVKVGRKKADVKKGDVVTSIISGDKYRIEDSQFKRSFRYIVSLIELGDRTRSKTKDLNNKYSIDEKFMGVEYVPEGVKESQNSYIPRPYGMYNNKEFYAVLWESWFQDKLKDPAKIWFENLER